jgi:hypothetical protein
VLLVGERDAARPTRRLVRGAVAGLFASFGRRLPPDSSWPVAIYVSMLMPIGFLLAIMRAAKLRPQAATAELVLWGLLGLAVAGFVFAVLLIGIST